MTVYVQLTNEQYQSLVRDRPVTEALDAGALFRVFKFDYEAKVIELRRVGWDLDHKEQWLLSQTLKEDAEPPERAVLKEDPVAV